MNDSAADGASPLRPVSYQFVKSRRWIAGHLLAGGLLTVFVVAGFWQLGRHFERAEINAATEMQIQLQPLGQAELLGELGSAESTAPESLEHRLVRLDRVASGQQFRWD